MLKAQIFEARVFHSRQHEKKHTFAYSLYLFALNIDQKPHWPSFVFSLNPKDYLSGEGTTLRERFDQTCDRFGFDLQAEQVLLLTSARFLGYTFNPVSFWFSYCQKGLLEGVLAEVNNTFGESHFYLMRPKNEGDIQFEHPKQFHVSPFFDRLGSYDWKVQDLQQGLRIQVSYREKDQQRFFASLEGQSLELNPANCWRTILKHPFSPWLTWPRIHIQAGILYFRHKVTFFKKPVPDHPMTFRTSPIWPHEKLAFYLVRRAFSKLKKGQLRLILPDQTELFFGQKNGHVSVLQVRDWSFFAALAYGSDIGFGDSYTDGYWDSPNLLQLLIFRLLFFQSLVRFLF